MSRNIKLSYNGINKLIPCPITYLDLFAKAKVFADLPDSLNFSLRSMENVPIKSQEELESLLRENPAKNLKVKIVIEEMPEIVPLDGLGDEGAEICESRGVCEISGMEQQENFCGNVEDEMKRRIEKIVNYNLSKTENYLVEHIYNKLKSSAGSILINKDNQSLILHNINCDECGTTNITGIRYKCANCSKNLCEDCESQNSHDQSHILIRINDPIPNEEYLDVRINKDIEYSTYPNKQYYEISPNVLILNKSNMTANVQIKNISSVTWPMGYSFKCLKEASEIIGSNLTISVKIQKGACSYLELKFNEGDKFDKEIGKEYNVYYQLYDNMNREVGGKYKFVVKFG